LDSFEAGFEGRVNHAIFLGKCLAKFFEFVTLIVCILHCLLHQALFPLRSFRGQSNQLTEIVLLFERLINNAINCVIVVDIFVRILEITSEYFLLKFFVKGKLVCNYVFGCLTLGIELPMKFYR
jgi:hypothetical protein